MKIVLISGFIQARRSYVSRKCEETCNLARRQYNSISQKSTVVAFCLTVLNLWYFIVVCGDINIGMDAVNAICDLLQSHVNRDKVTNLACYSLKFVGSSCKSKELMTASARLAATRATLRLFDDAALFKTITAYGLGEKDGPIWGPISVAGNMFTFAYLQAEKISWLIDTGILKVSPEFEYKVKTAHKVFWGLYALCGLLKSIRALHQSADLLKSAQPTKCASARFTQASLTTTKLFLDVIHVVTWWPRGWLWGSAVRTEYASGIATLAAILGLVIHFNGQRLLPR